MNSLFTLLLLLSILCFLLNLVKPSLFKFENRKKGSSIFLGLTILFFILFGITSSPTPPAPQAVVNQVASSAPVTDSFDVPKLVGKDIDQIELTIGKADKTFEPTELQKSVDVTGDKTFVKGKTELTVEYDARTRKVKDLFISTDDPSGATSDKARLLTLGNLKEGASTYTIKFVPTIKDPSVFTGVIVTAK